MRYTSETNSTPQFQFPILSILGLIFITLKLTGHINWSWLWVLAPFWIPITFIVVLVIGCIFLSRIMKH